MGEIAPGLGIGALRGAGEEFLKKIVTRLEQKLREFKIEGRVEWRIKRLYSIQQKLQDQKIPVDQVYDLLAIRVITHSVQDCYALLGLLHSIWRPVPGRIKDFMPYVTKIKASGADTLMDFTTPKFAAQTIKKNGELNWKPLHIVTNVSISVGAVMKPAGFEHGQGVLSAAYLKDGADPQWNNDEGMKKWIAFVDKYMPGANKADSGLVYGYGAAQTLHKVLEMAGDNLTRENVMKQAASLKDFQTDVALPGIKINTSATDFAPFQQVRMMRFKGDKWELFGDIISSDGH